MPQAKKILLFFSYWEIAASRRRAAKRTVIMYDSPRVLLSLYPFWKEPSNISSSFRDVSVHSSRRGAKDEARVLGLEGCDGYVSHMTVTCRYINLPLISICMKLVSSPGAPEGRFSSYVSPPVFSDSPCPRPENFRDTPLSVPDLPAGAASLSAQQLQPYVRRELSLLR